MRVQKAGKARSHDSYRRYEAVEQRRHYVFYIDFEGHMEDEQVRKVLAEVDEEAVELKRLGSYPIGVL